MFIRRSFFFVLLGFFGIPSPSFVTSLWYYNQSFTQNAAIQWGIQSSFSHDTIDDTVATSFIVVDATFNDYALFAYTNNQWNFVKSELPYKPCNSDGDGNVFLLGTTNDVIVASCEGQNYLSVLIESIPYMYEAPPNTEFSKSVGVFTYSPLDTPPSFEAFIGKPAEDTVYIIKYPPFYVSVATLTSPVFGIQYGNCVRVSRDGSTLVVGTLQNLVYVYVYGEAWPLNPTFTINLPSPSNTSDSFSSSTGSNEIILTRNGDVLLFGGNSNGIVYIYTIDKGNTWSYLTNLTGIPNDTSFGTSLTLTSDDTYLAISAPVTNQVYVYAQRYPGEFFLVQRIIPHNYRTTTFFSSPFLSNFGQHVSFSAQGNWLIIGEPSSSIIHLYKAGNPVPTSSATASATSSATSTSTSSSSSSSTATKTATSSSTSSSSATRSSTATSSATSSATSTWIPGNSCPSGFYGPHCMACPGTIVYGTACDGHGICNGDGTRSGTGVCICYVDWIGSDCSEAQPSPANTAPVTTSFIVGVTLGPCFLIFMLVFLYLYYRRHEKLIVCNCFHHHYIHRSRLDDNTDTDDSRNSPRSRLMGSLNMDYPSPTAPFIPAKGAVDVV